MSEPRDMIIPILRDLREQIDRNHRDATNRLERIEANQVSFKRALTAEALLGRLVVGEYEERISALEKRVADLTSETE